MSNACGMDETMRSNRRNKWRPANLCAAAVGLACLLPAPAAANIPLEERQVLLDLYRSTHGSEWKDNTDWNSEPGSECQWFGIVCGSGDDHVQGITLERNGLSGPLPRRLNQLKFLIHLSLPDNELTGSIPSLSGLQSLQYVELSRNQLTGALPDLSGLARLTSFSASHNQLSGAMPRMTGLPALEFLNVSDNRLSGPIPGLDALPHLKAINLSSNELSGAIPGFNGLSLLHDVYLDHNRLSGSIPEFHDMNELRYIRLSHNQLTGPIPNLSGVPNLQDLDIGDNQLTGGLPAAPRRASSASLCPNPLDHPSADARLDAAWSKLTRDKPWWQKCAPK